MSRVMGYEHTVVVALRVAGARLAQELGGQERYYTLVAEELHRREAPKSHAEKVLQGIRDGFITVGVDPTPATGGEAPPKDVQDGWTDSESEADPFLDDDGFDYLSMRSDDEREVAEGSGSALKKAMRVRLDEWRSKHKFGLIFEPIKVEGKKYYLASTWLLRGPGFLWNLNGMGEGRALVISKDDDVRVHEEGQAVCLSQDFVFESEVKYDKSEKKGTRQPFEATIFLWALKYVPGRVFRYWLNESCGKGASKDLTRLKKQIV